jgi:hypothetical protein
VIPELSSYYACNKIPDSLTYFNDDVHMPFFRVLELKDHAGNTQSVVLQVKYCQYSTLHGNKVYESDWMKVPRVQDTNGL